MRAPVERCPYCESEEGYYSRDYVHGSARTFMKFDGSEAENWEMYDHLTHRMGKNAHCTDCHKVIFKIEELFNN